MSQYALVNIACLPLRSEPSEKAEMATQVLFGDVVYVIEEFGNWVRVHCPFDDYIGWIDSKTLYYIDNYTESKNNTYYSTDSLFSWAINADGQRILIPAGATLLNYSEANNTFNMFGTTYQLTQPLNLYKATANNVIHLATQFLNCPYLWGGKTAFGIDCSGLVQIVYKIIKVPLLRDAKHQVYQGITINFIEEALPADLLFFHNEHGQIIHVGIYLGNNKIIHASGKVRIDDVDNYGIYRKDCNKYTHTLATIKRILNE
ncbi:MAG: C40 family peptidase [Bacteroidales bacterium]|nr:C40 family peptidase [Bacteroidales bacterium]